MVVTIRELLGSDASNFWPLVAITAIRYCVPGFSFWIVKEFPVALVVAFTHFWPSSEY